MQSFFDGNGVRGLVHSWAVVVKELDIYDLTTPPHLENAYEQYVRNRERLFVFINDSGDHATQSWQESNVGFSIPPAGLHVLPLHYAEVE